MSNCLPLTAFEDPALPTLASALQPTFVERALVSRLADVVHGRLTLRAVRIKAYKPLRRCLIEYELQSEDSRHDIGSFVLLGKIRANRFGNSGYRRLRALWEHGFDDNSADRVSVPEPIATVPALRMWLQRRVPGTVATDLLLTGQGDRLAEPIAAAVHKLHTCGLAADKRHTIDDELMILSASLESVASARRDLAPRVGRLIDACVRLGHQLPVPRWCGSHRDFYSDQVIVSADRLYLLDFDLFCEADPGLDIGNFLGHVTELSLRRYGSAHELAGVERRLEHCFAQVAGDSVRWPVRVYAALTLARHVFLSTRFPDRAHLTPVLLADAERRVAQAAAEGGHS